MLLGWGPLKASNFPGTIQFKSPFSTLCEQMQATSERGTQRGALLLSANELESSHLIMFVLVHIEGLEIEEAVLKSLKYKET